MNLADCVKCRLGACDFGFAVNKANRSHLSRVITRPLFTAIFLAVAPLPTIASPAWGTGMGGASASSDQIARDFGADGMNGQTVRLDAKATGIEPQEGNLRWSALDRQVGAIVSAKARVDILLVVTAGFNPPAWMCHGYTAGIPNPDLYADFFLAVVARYSAPPYNLTFFEVYNEPNYQFTELGKDVRERADHYAMMLEKVWSKTQSLRQRNPAIRILGGSTAGPPKSARATDTDYFDQLWNVRAAHRFMHCYSFHVYIRGADMASGGYVAPEFPFGKPSRGLLWQDILVPSAAVDWHGKPVWLTELGYDSAHSSLGLSQEEREANQARWEVRAAITCRAAPGNFIRRFLQFNSYSNGSEAYGFRRGVGGAAKPQWHAWKTLNHVLDDAVTSVRMQAYCHVTLGDMNHCVFSYTKSNGHFGWATWWVPAGQSGNVVLGTDVTGDVYTRTMMADAWDHLGRFNHGAVSVTATNDPLYVEVHGSAPR